MLNNKSGEFGECLIVICVQCILPSCKLFTEIHKYFKHKSSMTTAMLIQIIVCISLQVVQYSACFIASEGYREDKRFCPRTFWKQTAAAATVATVYDGQLQ